jgi:hypothetical protein
MNFCLSIFQIMSENKESSNLEENPEPNDLNLNINHQESHCNNEDNTTKNEDNQWINELRAALERGCDLGTIRSIGQCRALTDDLRLRVWKVRKRLDKVSFISISFFRHVLISMKSVMNINTLTTMSLIYLNKI